MQTALTQPETYARAGAILLIYAFTDFIARRVPHHTPMHDEGRMGETAPLIRRFLASCGHLIFPLTAIVMRRVTQDQSAIPIAEGR